MKIIVNGKKIDLGGRGLRAIDTNFLSYDFIVACAGYAPKQVLSVVYSSKFNYGIVIPGTNIKLTDGMIFNVADCSNS